MFELLGNASMLHWFNWGDGSELADKRHADSNAHSTPSGGIQEQTYAEMHLRWQNAPKSNLHGGIVKS